MKNKLKKIKPLFIILFAILFSCEKDLYNEKENPENSIKTSKVTLQQLLNETKNTLVKENLNNLLFVNSQKNSTNRVNNSEIIFTKKEKENVLTTYLLNINSYSLAKPYFLKLIITNNANEICKIGYLKYIPTNALSTLNLKTFTGEVQILNFNSEITAKSNYINGIKQEDTTTTNRITCTNEIEVTEKKCSNGGDHGVGETCYNASGTVIPNDAHYIITIFERCTSRAGELVQIIEDSSNGNTDMGGVYPASIILNPFLNTLTDAQLDIYNANPLIQEYLLNNIEVTPNPNYDPLIGGEENLIGIKPEAEEAVTFALDNIVSVFSTIDQNSNNLTTGEIAQLKYKALSFLLKNPNQEGASLANEASKLSINLEIDAFDVWEYDYDLFRAQMSNDERNIFDNMLINRRLMYTVAAKKAINETTEHYPTTAKNGTGDAFRHALWNGMSSLLIGQDLTEQLTTAHETRPSDYNYTYKEKEMDLYNNSKGRQIANYSNIFSITDNVLDYLQIGGLRFLNNLDINSLATNNSVLVPTN